ncbi:hypothetical protein YC2023_099443 [Brassica napus]
MCRRGWKRSMGRMSFCDRIKKISKRNRKKNGLRLGSVGVTQQLFGLKTKSRIKYSWNQRAEMFQRSMCRLTHALGKSVKPKDEERNLACVCMKISKTYGSGMFFIDS